jgi:hypothetical protein
VDAVVLEGLFQRIHVFYQLFMTFRRAYFDILNFNFKNKAENKEPCQRHDDLDPIFRERYKEFGKDNQPCRRENAESVEDPGNPSVKGFRAEPLCRLLNRPLLPCVALTGQWRYSLHTDKLTATMQIAERIHSLAREQKDAALMIEAYRALAVTLYYSGDYETAQQALFRCGAREIFSLRRKAPDASVRLSMLI